MSDPWSKSRVLLRHELKQIRLQSGLTQAEVAERLNKPQSYVSKLESGDRTLDLIETREFCLACGERFDHFVQHIEKKLAKGQL
jgi:transcriptional regulator with XRE-family HTH domain